MELSEVKLLIVSLNGRDKVTIVLERFRAPRVVETIIRSLPISARVFSFKEQGYIYISLSSISLGISARTRTLRRGLIYFTSRYPGLVIALRDNVHVPYSCLEIGRVADEVDLNRLSRMSSLSVTIKSAE